MEFKLNVSDELSQQLRACLTPSPVFVVLENVEGMLFPFEIGPNNTLIPCTPFKTKEVCEQVLKLMNSEL